MKSNTKLSSKIREVSKRRWKMRYRRLKCSSGWKADIHSLWEMKSRYTPKHARNTCNLGEITSDGKPEFAYWSRNYGWFRLTSTGPLGWQCRILTSLHVGVQGTSSSLSPRVDTLSHGRSCGLAWSTFTPAFCHSLHPGIWRVKDVPETWF